METRVEITAVAAQLMGRKNRLVKISYSFFFLSYFSWDFSRTIHSHPVNWIRLVRCRLIHCLFIVQINDKKSGVFSPTWYSMLGKFTFFLFPYILIAFRLLRTITVRVELKIVAATCAPLHTLSQNANQLTYLSLLLFPQILLPFRWFHLAFNLIVQLLVGLPLEMVHGSSRIACVYLAGVLAGSMGTSIFDPDVYLVGASGGVYALLAAHLANVMLNYNNMHYGIIRIVGIFLFGK